jgi:hypothetical protein
MIIGTFVEHYESDIQHYSDGIIFPLPKKKFNTNHQVERKYQVLMKVTGNFVEDWQHRMLELFLADIYFLSSKSKPFNKVKI